MDNTNNTRFNMPMSSIDSKGLQYLSDRLSKNPNSRFVCAIARLNPKYGLYWDEQERQGVCHHSCGGGLC